MAPFKMKGFSPFHQEEKQKLDPKEIAKKAASVAGKLLKGKRRKRPAYIKSDPGLMRYYDAYDAWEDRDDLMEAPPSIHDYKPDRKFQ